MSVRVRFAPSPTGMLHLGNARIAVINWLFARHEGGIFLLRMDDTDTERSDTAFETAIQADLGWLGLAWDEYARQSERLDRYAAAADRLRLSGRLYACYETEEELSLKRRQLAMRGLPPVYDRAALKLSEAERDAFAAEGRRPHWRFLLDERAVAWDDLVQGSRRFEPGHVSDPVLVREDGRPLYTLSSVVDDIELGVTHVIRGADHVNNTAAQVQLFEALGAGPPAFAHLPLLTDREGRNLSKREGSLSLDALRQQEIETRAIILYLAHLGMPVAARAEEDTKALIQRFDIGAFGRGTTRFDADDLRRFSAEVVRHLSWEDVRGRISIEGVDEGFWLAVRPNIDRLSQLTEWWEVCRGAVTPRIEDPTFCRRAAELLPPEPWDSKTFSAWTEAVKRETGAKGRALYKPLRLALTGREEGPELAVLLPLLGRERAVARLRGCTGAC